jgi:dTDP-4-amino-4,6-dideoxygalactose transaminase
LEEKLAVMHNRKHCILVSRGATAIYLALKAFGYEKGQVALPSILCMSPANAVIYAGLEPVYIDISLADFNLDVKSLARAIKTEKNMVAVILPHLYGQPGEIDKVIALCKKYNIRIIEDAAQALGGSYQGRPLGSFGDISILSFGHTKIIDAGGGGAILFDDKKYLPRIKAAEKLIGKKKDNYAELSSAYRDAYYSLAELCRQHPGSSALYSAFPAMFKDLYLFRDLTEELVLKIDQSLKDLAKIADLRRRNASICRKMLQHDLIVHPKHKWDGVPWRYSFLVKSDKQWAIAEAARKRGLDISNWYPPLHLLYDAHPAQLKNAEYLGEHVFNLWVDQGLNEDAAKRNCRIFLEV